MPKNATPRVYVACLASYNAGKLHGSWVDAVDADEIQATIDDVLRTSPIPNAEEFAIHDSEGFCSAGAGISNESVEDIAKLGALIQEHGEIAAALWGFHDKRIDAIEDAFEYHYQGSYRSLEEYAEDLFTNAYDLSSIPDVIKFHIDWEAVARDLELSGDIYSLEADGSVHVFDN